MQVSETVAGDIVVVSVEGRLDSTTSAALGSRLDPHVSGPTRLLLDLQGVEFISSAGLRVILATLKKLRASGGKLALCGVHRAVQEVLEITGLATLLPTHPTQQAGLKALGTG